MEKKCDFFYSFINSNKELEGLFKENIFEVVLKGTPLNLPEKPLKKLKKRNMLEYNAVKC